MKKLFIILLILLIPATVCAKDLYVNGATGNDATNYATNDIDNQWETLGRALWGVNDRDSADTTEAAKAGDTVNIAAGLYTTTGFGDNSGVAFNPVNEGTIGNPITFSGAGTTTILRQISDDGPVMGSYQRDYIIWSNLKVAESNTYPAQADFGPVAIAGADNVTLDRITIQAITAQYSDNHSGIRIQNSTNVTISNSTIYDVRGYNGSPNNNCPGIMLYKSNDIIIRNNEIYDSDGGIFVKGSYEDGVPVDIQYNIAIYNNLIHDLNLNGIIVMGTDGTLPTTDVYQNVIYDCGAAGIRFFGADGTTYGPQPQLSRVVNNTVFECNQGIYFKAVASWDTTNISYNNIIYGGTRALNADDVTAPGQTYLYASDYMDSDYNLYYGWSSQFHNITNSAVTSTEWSTAPYNQDVHMVLDDPAFTDTTTRDFTLQGGSPAINAGIDILDLDNDSSTADSITLGAYITGDEIIGVGPSEVALVVTITAPTSSSTYETATETMTLGGTAAYESTITSVAWANSEASTAGTCSGTTAWTCEAHTLVEDSNNIRATVTAADASTAGDTLTVTYSPAGESSTHTLGSFSGGGSFQ